jgi:hypothetical protein
VSRSSDLLHVEASRARVFHSDFMTGGGAMQMVSVASLRRLRRAKAEDGRVDTMGCIRPLYPNFIVFYILDRRSILVFCLGI